MKKVEAGYFITGTLLGEGLLDGEEILTRAIHANPSLSVVMEMTVKRENGMSKNEVLIWERHMVEDAKRLHALIAKI